MKSTVQTHCELRSTTGENEIILSFVLTVMTLLSAQRSSDGGRLRTHLTAVPTHSLRLPVHNTSSGQPPPTIKPCEFQSACQVAPHAAWKLRREYRRIKKHFPAPRGDFHPLTSRRRLHADTLASLQMIKC